MQRRIILAYAVNRLGTWFGLLALLVAVFDDTHSALAVAALLFAGQALPALVVPAVIARVEVSKRRGELSALYFFEALATAALAVLLWHFWLPAVLLLVTLDGIAALTASALLRTELARVARAEVGGNARAEVVQELGGNAAEPSEPLQERALQAERTANAALNIAFSSTFVIGPALAGAMVAAAGPSAALFVDVGSFALGGTLLIHLHSHVESMSNDSVRGRLQAAWRHINEAPSLRGLLLTEAAALIFMEASGPIEVTFVKATLHAGDRGLGILLTTWGAGSILGSLVFARLIRQPLGVLLSVGTLAIGAADLGLSAAPSLGLACVAGLIGGIGNGLQWPSLISAVQRLTPQALHGRLMGAVESLGAFSVAIGLPLGGGLVALSSPRGAFIVVGAGAVITTAALVRVSRSSLVVPPPSEGLAMHPPTVEHLTTAHPETLSGESSPP